MAIPAISKLELPPLPIAGNLTLDYTYQRVPGYEPMSAPDQLDIEAISYEINLEIDRGATFNQQMIWKHAQDMDFPLNPENPPIGVDLENCVGSMEVKKSHFSPEVLLTPTVTLEKEDVQGAIEFDITEADIDSLLPRDKFSYTLTILFPSSRKRKLIRGRMNIKV